MYRAGWSRREIAVVPRGLAMHGFGMPQHRALGRQTPLYARAVFLRDARGRTLIFCCLDLGYVTHAMRGGVDAVLRREMGTDYDDAALVLTCTHTHSGPGGCSHDVLYNLVTPGFVPEHLAAVVEAAAAAILTAWRDAAPAQLGLVAGAFDPAVPVAWNRSLRAYNRNPEVQPRGLDETHLALDRGMQVLSLRRDGRVHALVSLFGVHATCLGAGLRNYDGDNKGYAAAQAERALQRAGAADAVAIFAQATAGDVSPHFHGPRQAARRKALRGAAEVEYAQDNGRRQSELALALLASGAERPLSGGIDAVFSYADLSAVHADAEFAGGETQAYTSEPCHGLAFFAGTPVDGPGIAAPLAAVIKRAALLVQKLRLRSRDDTEDQAYYRRLYAAQSPKAVLIEAGRKRVLGRPLEKVALPGFLDPSVAELKRQVRAGAVKDSAMIPSVLPLQIVTIGGLALVCCPGEFTTTAGARLRQTVQQRLAAQGIERVLICTYCNDYMGYVTTRQEYEEQAYEGGHTVYGKWTLAAFQTLYARLARQLLQPEGRRTHDRGTRPAPVPAGELALRTNRFDPGLRESKR